jgi:nicotinate phosphoribosyltransferase
MLNDEGFEDVSIVLSNQLDEQVLSQIIDQIHEEAPDYNLDPENVVDRLVYGVGTRLITSQGDASLGGVYKLVGLKEKGNWNPVLKISESIEKVPNPGQKTVWRLYDQRGKATVDLIGTQEESLPSKDPITLRHPTNPHASRELSADDVKRSEKLHEVVLENGKRRSEGDIARARDRHTNDLNSLDPGVKRIMNPHEYHVSLTPAMWDRKQRLLESIQNQTS